MSRPLRLVVTGGESAGKTSLARLLARELNAPLSEEFSRLYAESHDGPLLADDVAPIARGQIAMEDAVLRAAGRLAIHDTDLLSTVVYARHYYGSCAGWIREAAFSRVADLYLLCAPDLPWEADGVRDRPEARTELHRLFAEVLQEAGANAVLVSGLGEARHDVARAAARALLEGRPA